MPPTATFALVRPRLPFARPASVPDAPERVPGIYVGAVAHLAGGNAVGEAHDVLSTAPIPASKSEGWGTGAERSRLYEATSEQLLRPQ